MQGEGAGAQFDDEAWHIFLRPVHAVVFSG